MIFSLGLPSSIPIRARSSPVICANQIARQFGAFNPPHARATKLSRCNSCERAKKENAAWQAVVRASIERLSCEIYFRGRWIRCQSSKGSPFSTLCNLLFSLTAEYKAWKQIINDRPYQKCIIYFNSAMMCINISVPFSLFIILDIINIKKVRRKLSMNFFSQISHVSTCKWKSSRQFITIAERAKWCIYIEACLNLRHSSYVSLELF